METKQIIFHEKFCSLDGKKDLTTSASNILSVFSDHLEYEKMDGKATQHCNMAATVDHTRYSHGHGNQFSFTTVMLRRVEKAGCAHYMACCAKIYENKTLYGALFADTPLKWF